MCTPSRPLPWPDRPSWLARRGGWGPRLRTAVCCLAWGLASSLATPAMAQLELGDTLERIRQTGTINLGHRESSVPFSYYDARRQVVGYSHELMLRLLDPIKAELKLPALTIKLVPVTTQNRIPMLQNGSIDIECGSTTHNRERERQVAFSTSIFVVGTRLMVPRGSRIRGPADVDGKRVVVTAGTTSERLLRAHAETHSFSLLTARDHDASFARLQAGEADAFLMDDALLHGLRSRTPRPDDWEVVGAPMSTEVYACMMRLGDVRLKRVVDRTFTQLMRSGEALKLYQRWFQKPIPPRGLNLNWPPSADLLALYAHPNDNPRD